MSLESPRPSPDAATADPPSALAPTRPRARWSWLRPLVWLDELAVPPWAPEGDPSLAVRDREA